MCADSGDIDVPTEVTGQIAEVSALLDDRSGTASKVFERDTLAYQRDVAYLLALSHQSGLAMAS